MTRKKQYSEEIQRLLKSVIDDFDEEERSVRQRQIRTWRRLKILWDGFRNQYYNEVAHDWRVPPNLDADQAGDQAYYDKPINVLRAYLESIIAALSVTVPKLRTYPDDAKNSLDLLTARASDEICKLVYRHNDVELLWLHALFIWATEGMVACYNYPKSDKEYGQYEENTYQDREETHELTTCPNCGYEFDDQIVDTEQPIGQMEGIDNCPECGIVQPQMERNTVIISELIRKEFKNKTRICMECFGGLFVRIPNYARKQSDIPVLGYDYETHYVNVIRDYGNDISEELKEKLKGAAGGLWDPYEAWGRLNTQYSGEIPVNNITCRNRWLRPCAFDILDEKEAAKLRKEFPDGVKVVLANDEYLTAYPEKLDDCWTITYNPLADYLHHDPLELLLVSTQEITNDLISLTIQTIEHGIGQTFADPKVLNFAQYKQMETVPGAIYPTKSSNKPLSEGFFEVKTATLSQEVLPFGQNIQQLGQLVSGALPSLFGGAMQEQKTASGYAMSREQALQRQQNTWKLFTNWWKKVFMKVIPQYIENMHEDERDVQRKDGNFVNVFIRKADLEGKIGKIELDANENLPISWSQRKQTYMELLQTNNERILEILGSPENLPIAREVLGLEELYVPGEDDRNKQYEEIELLLNSEPIMQPPDPMMAQMAAQDPMMLQQAMQPQMVPSVQIDPDIDNHEIQFEICRSWLVSDAGRLEKVENPAGYENVLLHAKAHLQIIQQNMMAEQEAMAMASGKGAAPDKKPKETEKEAPISNEGDVNQ